MDSQYLFVVKRDFKTVDGRQCSAGNVVTLTDRDEVRRLLSLGFVIPGGKRTTDRVESGVRKWKAVNETAFYTR